MDDLSWDIHYFLQRGIHVYYANCPGIADTNRPLTDTWVICQSLKSGWSLVTKSLSINPLPWSQHPHLHSTEPCLTTLLWPCCEEFWTNSGRKISWSSPRLYEDRRCSRRPQLFQWLALVTLWPQYIPIQVFFCVSAPTHMERMCSSELCPGGSQFLHMRKCWLTHTTGKQ